MKRKLATVIASILIAGCAPPPNGAGPSAESGFNAFGTGLGYLVLSPFLIAAGLLEGIASLPWLMAGGVHELNQGMVNAQASATLDDTYRAAYGRRLAEVPDNGETGVVFHRMDDATRQFQRVLGTLGVPDPEHYILTAVRTADREGYTLYAVVYRDIDRPRVMDKYAPDRLRILTRDGLPYYVPYERDVTGRALDRVIDWAGVPRTMIATQKGQALLMTLAANSVLRDKVAPEYWEAERRWMAGEFRQIVAENEARLRARLGTAD